MCRLIKILPLLILFLTCYGTRSQTPLSNIREQQFSKDLDTLVIDTISIVPKSLKIMDGDAKIPSNSYHINPSTGRFFWKERPSTFKNDSLTFIYRVLPINLSKDHQKRTEQQIDTPMISYRDRANQKRTPRKPTESRDNYGQLERNGSITRGIRFGNNQDLSLNSNLDLQLAGNLTEDIQLQASITDQNLPIEPEGNTAQIQDFDQVKIELTTKNESLTLGDFQMQPYEDDYFMSYFKKTQGISFERTWKTSNNAKANVGTDFGFSRGKFARNTFNGNEGDQGPYQLTGNNGEIYIIIVAGTERVYLNGQKLNRGEQADYTIDYNSGEITFTQEHIISQNDRIVVEFQYAKRNYERSILHSYGKLEKEDWSIRANIFSEQDHRKSPIFQDLTDEDEALMQKVGDSTNKAVRPSYERTSFSEDQILYKRIDTAGFSGIFKYTNTPTDSTYQVSFSNVGQGKGNYVKARSKANGQVFKWVKPQNGQKRGAYEPIKQLVTPQKQQMATLGGDFKFLEDGEAGIELALSNRDVNTFSNKHQDNDQDIAGQAYIENTFDLSNGEEPWQLFSKASMEIKNANFSPIERYRPVEFERTWNRQLNNPNKNVSEDERLGEFQLRLTKSDFLKANYKLSNFKRNNQFQGWLHETGLKLNFEKYHLAVQNDFTNVNASPTSNNFNSKDFLHQKAHVSREMGFAKAGIKYEREVNQHFQKSNKSLDSQSFRYEEWQAYVKSPDTSSQNYALKFTQRYNYSPTKNDFSRTTKSDIYSAETKLHKSKNHDIDFQAQYRRFDIISNEVQNQEAKNSAVGNLEWDWEGLNDLVQNKTFYQLGSGKEQRTTYNYVRARGDGRGNYVWEDYNNNGVQEIDEFQLATNANNYRANYIRIVTPTNEFISTISNEFRESIQLTPKNLWRENDGFLGLLAKFRNETNWSVRQKVFNRQNFKQYNPFNQSISDTNLVATNSRLKNILYFNKTHPKWGVNYRYNETSSKNLLSNGFTSHSMKENSVVLRWNVSKSWTLRPEYLKGKETSQSELLTQQNYQVHYDQIKSEVGYQPTGKFQTSLSYTYEDQENRLKDQNESSTTHQIGAKFQYNWIGKGNINARINYSKINFKGKENSAAAYQMLQGLSPGNNMTWRLMMNYELGENLQLSIQYNGRNSENQRTIHQSNVNVRYLF